MTISVRKAMNKYLKMHLLMLWQLEERVIANLWVLGGIHRRRSEILKITLQTFGFLATFPGVAYFTSYEG